MDLFTESLRKLTAASGIPLSTEQLQKMSSFYAMLEEANRSFNLTSIKGPKESSERHFMDSLALPALNHISPDDRVIDVGTGAGFPGIPIAILRNNLKITLLDSMLKRTTFLEAATKLLNLPNVNIITSRAEDYAQGSGREKYDVALSRAVAPLNVLLEYTLPFVHAGGHILAWKGPSATEEISISKNACRILGGGEMKAYAYSLSDRNNFSIVYVEKIRPTPRIYPRKAGKPSSSPLL